MAKYIIDLKDDECLYKVVTKGSKLDFQKIYEDDMERFEEPMEEEPRRWRADYGCNYSWVGAKGKVIISTDVYDVFTNWQYASGNYFRTKEEAEEYREKLIVYNELKAYAEPDDEVWNDSNSYHWYILWDVREHVIDYNYNNYYKSSVLYFPLKEIAEEAVKAVGEERVKRYYLGIKENENGC